jgi:predicted ArsR family transcriptional regulator
MTRERDDTGQYVETVGPEAVLDVLDAVDGPAITSSDVADHLECTTEAARQKLQRLVDDGTLARRKTGRTVIYWADGD